MLQKDKYSVINIRKYLDSDDPRLGEDELIQILSEFSCGKKHRPSLSGNACICRKNPVK